MYIKQQLYAGCVISGDIRGWGDDLQRHIGHGFEVISRNNLYARPFAHWPICFPSTWLIAEDSVERNIEVARLMIEI